LEPVKGQSVLLDALNRVCATGVDARLTLVGYGRLKESLEHQAKELGIADRVTFTGRIGQDEILRYYELADVFCLPSFTEGLPVVLMEAMATELPVIASGVMGIPEIVDDRVGRLVPPGRPDHLADAIREIAALPDRGRALGAEGRRRVADEFEVGGAADALLEVMRTYGALASPSVHRELANG
jgi:glycosyltransferase involved in cell wall biosynthesis